MGDEILRRTSSGQMRVLRACKIEFDIETSFDEGGEVGE